MVPSFQVPTAVRLSTIRNRESGPQTFFAQLYIRPAFPDFDPDFVSYSVGNYLNPELASRGAIVFPAVQPLGQFRNIVRSGLRQINFQRYQLIAALTVLL